MSRLLHTVLVVCVLTTGLASIPGALAAGPYGLDSPSAVDVPTQTVRGDGEFLTVRDIARVTKGDPFEIQTTAPESAAYGVEIRNMHGIVVDISDRTLRGTDSTTFTTDYLKPGSYVAVLVHGGEAKAVLPVVIEGYGVSVETPESAEAGTDVTVSAALTATPAAPDIERVELLVVDRSTKKVVVQQPMTADGSGYTTTFRLDDPGEYSLCVNVRGESSVRGFNELLGFSDAHAVSLTEPESPGEESAAAAAPESGTATPSASATPTPSTTVPDGVITRNPTDDPTNESNDPTTVVLSLLFGLLLLIGFGLLYVLRF